MIDELPIPPETKTAKKSLEFARGWIIDGTIYCSLNVGVWGKKEPAFWGRFLSDVAQHISDALHKEKGLEKDTTVSAIRESFLKGLETSGAEFSGDFV